MARKGKEPAGLRRYRLEQKRKKAARKAPRRPKTRKVKTMARRRSYRPRRSYRRKAASLSPIGKGGIKVATAAVEGGLIYALFESGEGAASAWDAIKNKEYGNAVIRYIERMNPMKYNSGKLVVGGAAAGWAGKGRKFGPIILR